jgi:hypothetical protein
MDSKNYGYIPDPEHQDAYAAEASGLYGNPLDYLKADMDLPAFPYRAAAHALADTKWTKRVEGQTLLLAQSQGGVGSCVGWGEARKILLSLAAGVYMREEEIALPLDEDGKPCGVSPSWCYAASRQVVGKLGRSDGSNGSWAARATAEMGFLFEKKYPEFDARGYSEADCRNWAAKGVPKDSLQYGAESRYTGRMRVETVEQAVALTQAGFSYNLCNDHKPNDTRDEHGFCKRSGSWSHSETGGICYVVYKISPTKTKRGIGILNSHGNNRYKGPKGELTPDLPSGAYIFDLETIQDMLDRGDTWVSFDRDGLAPPIRDWEARAGL